MKLNKGHWSIRDFFVGKPNSMGDIKYNPTRQGQLLGSLQPFGDLVKEVTDTAKPYRTPQQFWFDLVLPIRGPGLMFAGAFYFGLSLAVPTTLAVGRLFGLTQRKPSAAQVTSWALLGGFSIVTGAITLASSIVLYPIKLLTRLGITFTKYFKGELSSTPLEKRPIIQRLVASVTDSIKSLRDLLNSTNEPANAQIRQQGIDQLKASSLDLCVELHRKYENAIKKGYPSSISNEEEHRLFNRIDPNNPTRRRGLILTDVTDYVSLFVPKQNVPQADAPRSEQFRLSPDYHLPVVIEALPKGKGPSEHSFLLGRYTELKPTTKPPRDTEKEIRDMEAKIKNNPAALQKNEPSAIRESYFDSPMRAYTTTSPKSDRSWVLGLDPEMGAGGGLEMEEISLQPPMDRWRRQDYVPLSDQKFKSPIYAGRAAPGAVEHNEEIPLFQEIPLADGPL